MTQAGAPGELALDRVWVPATNVEQSKLLNGAGQSGDARQLLGCRHGAIARDENGVDSRVVSLIGLECISVLYHGKNEVFSAERIRVRRFVRPMG